MAMRWLSMRCMPDRLTASVVLICAQTGVQYRLMPNSNRLENRLRHMGRSP
ncbi:hypothetical protein D3C72_2126670 [compost metagenome]